MDENEVMLDEGWEEDSAGAPAETQQSGFGGERTSSAASEVSSMDGTEGYGACEDVTEVIACTVPGKDPSVQAPQDDRAGASPAPTSQPKPDLIIPKPGDNLLQKFRDRARQQDMERFLRTFPGVQASAIPRQVWERVAGGESLVSAYTMHENQRLQAELAAERRNQLNRQRSPGSLGANAGRELDELDRMWSEDD